MSFMDDHFDSRPIEEIYVDQYRNLYCKLLSKPNVLTVSGLMGGFTKNKTDPTQISFFLVDKKVIDTLNPDRPDGEIIMVCRHIQNAKENGKWAVYYNSQVYLLTKSEVDELKKHIDS
jgi:hypothetical protein